MICPEIYEVSSPKPEASLSSHVIYIGRGESIRESVPFIIFPFFHAHSRALSYLRVFYSNLKDWTVRFWLAELPAILFWFYSETDVFAAKKDFCEGMDATCGGVAPQFSTLIIGSKSIGRKLNVAMVPLKQRDSKECITKKCDFRPKSKCVRQRRLDFRLSHSCNHSQGRYMSVSVP